jgi:hypothetical protein
VRRADNLTTLMCRLSRNPGALTSRTPQGHAGLFRGYFTFLPMTRPCEHSNKHLCPLPGNEFHEPLIRYWLFTMVIPLNYELTTAVTRVP